ncbi:MAG: DNA-directed RNA polymerase subunit alpha C-terminal domain-containing protein [Culicoidibacterales bacterium]
MDNQYRERNRKIFLEKMNGNKTNLQISQEYGISLDRVRQILLKEAESFYKLKDAIEAIQESILCLNKNIFSIQNHLIEISKGDIIINKCANKSNGFAELNNDSIEYLELSVRSFNALSSVGIKDIDQLCNCSKSYLLRVPNFGKKSLREIEGVLKIKGRSLSDSDLRLKK